MEEFGESLRYVGIAGYLVITGNLLFWCVLIRRAGKNVLPTEFILFAVGTAFFSASLFAIALPMEWRAPMVVAARVLGMALALAFTAHTYYALQHRTQEYSGMTEGKLSDAQRKNIEAKIKRYLDLLATTTDEIQREHILFEIRALELLLDESDA